MFSLDPPFFLCQVAARSITFRVTLGSIAPPVSQSASQCWLVPFFLYCIRNPYFYFYLFFPLSPLFPSSTHFASTGKQPYFFAALTHKSNGIYFKSGSSASWGSSPYFPEENNKIYYYGSKEKKGIRQ